MVWYEIVRACCCAQTNPLSELMSGFVSSVTNSHCHYLGGLNEL